MMRLRLVLAFSAAFSLFVSGAATALPITYNFTTGSVVITASVLGSDIGSGTIDLDGSFVTFDEVPPSMDDFEFTATSQGPLVLTTPYSGYDTITLDALTVEPGAGYTTIFGFGGNPYTVTVGPIDVFGTVTITDSFAILPDVVALPFAFTTTSLTATVTIGASTTLDLTGLTLGTIGPFGTETDPITLKGDISFAGVVPEPATALLVGGGLVALGTRGRQRRRARAATTTG